MATITQRYDAVIDALTDPAVLTAGAKQKVYEATLIQSTDEQLKSVLGVENLTLLPDGSVDRALVSIAQQKGMYLWRIRYGTRTMVEQVQREIDNAAALAAAAIATADAVNQTGL